MGGTLRRLVPTKHGSTDLLSGQRSEVKGDKTTVNCGLHGLK